MLINESVHNDDLGEIIGDFHGIPVRTWNAKATRARETADIRTRIAARKAAELLDAIDEVVSIVFRPEEHEATDKAGIIRPLVEINNYPEMYAATA